MIEVKQWVHDSTLYYSLCLGIFLNILFICIYKGKHVLEGLKVFVNLTNKKTDVGWIAEVFEISSHDMSFNCW